MLVNGEWQHKWDPVQKQDAQGRFIRQDSQFRERLDDVQVDELERLQQEQGRAGLTLFAAYICPWASRALIARQLLGLEPWVDLAIVQPVLTDQGWSFDDYPGATSATEAGWGYVHEVYSHTRADYTGRATVPVLWYQAQQRIINNESADILQIFNRDLRPLHRSALDLSPETLQAEITRFNQATYHSLNNGVYRAGFAQSQAAYEEAFGEVFAALDRLECHFAEHDYAVGGQLTESDIRLFVTLVRFDCAYHGLFKTNRNRLAEFPALSAYLQRLLLIPAFADNTRINHIKSGYYSIRALNPSGIVPAGPDLDWFRLLSHH